MTFMLIIFSCVYLVYLPHTSTCGLFKVYLNKFS